MKEQMEALRQRFESELQAAQNSEAVEKLRVAYLGKKGSVTELLKGLKSVAGDQKKEMGQLINQLKRQVEEGIAQQVEKIRAAEEQAQIASAEQYDVTLPVDQSEGSYHPITLVQRQLEEIFSSMGFTIEDYKEIVTDYECFEAVNIPKHHPARDMQDTYYLDNGQLLKTHTSAAQNAIMRKYGAPLRAVFPGRCFRNEATDACHENTFFQMEGLMIDKDISISNLIYFMKTMLSGVRAGHHRAAAARVLPLCGARLRAGHLLPDLRRRGLPQLQELRLAGAVPLRDDSPQRAEDGRHRPGGVHGLCLWPGPYPPGHDEVRHQGYPRFEQRQLEGPEPV